MAVPRIRCLICEREVTSRRHQGEMASGGHGPCAEHGPPRGGILLRAPWAEGGRTSPVVCPVTTQNTPTQLITISGGDGVGLIGVETARSNARLAQLLAIGDLRKNAGADPRVTARGDVMIDKGIR